MRSDSNRCLYLEELFEHLLSGYIAWSNPKRIDERLATEFFGIYDIVFMISHAKIPGFQSNECGIVCHSYLCFHAVIQINALHHLQSIYIQKIKIDVR